MSLNLYDQFHERALRQVDDPAVIGPVKGQVRSYWELDSSIRALSDKLRSLGVGPWQCVGLHVGSSPQYIIATYAIWRCGACVAPIPVELTASEKGEICRCLALDFVISSERSTGAWPKFQAAKSAALGDGIAIAPLYSEQQHPPGFADINAAFIRFTSGTTGASKGVVLSHESIDERIRAANEVLNIGSADRVLWVLSMSYHFTVSIVGYLAQGAAIVLPANHFAAAMSQAMLEHQATVLYASPLHFSLLADDRQGKTIPSLRLAISTTGPLDGGVAARFHERYGQPVAQALGIIEAGLPFIHVNPTPERWSSVGRVLPAYELKLADIGLGKNLGEVLIRGPGFLDAYYAPFRTRQEIMDDGWFRTGDVGHLDEAGYLFLRGRSKDVINIMGMKFFPQEVERVLMTHPNVQAAAVFAGSNSHWGETVQARIVLKDCDHNSELERQLKQHCRKQLASFKVPQSFEFVAALPQTASGKILHRAVSRAG